MSSWTECKLGDVVNLKRGYDLPSSKRIDGEYPIVSSSGVSGLHCEFKVKAPGVVTGRYGTLGEVFYLTEDFWPLNTSLYVQDFKGNHPRYISYLLKTLYFQRQNVAGAVPGVNRNYLHMLPVHVPKIELQNKIAAILSAYDDLIENNLKRIKILEEMAQMIYREWFVNFRFPNHESVKMVDSHLGNIPDGWEVKPLRELVSYYIGGGWGNEVEDDNHTEEAYVIRGTDMPSARQGTVIDCPCRFHKASNLKSRKLQANDIVLEVSGGSKGQPVGRNIMIDDELLSQFPLPVMCASFCKLVRINEKFSAYYIDQLIQDLYTSGEILKYQTQSTGISNFKFEFFLDDVKLAVPNKDVLDNFDNALGSMYLNIYKLGKRNTNLRKTRDLLLPKLISGELDVENLDIKVPEEVG